MMHITIGYSWIVIMIDKGHQRTLTKFALVSTIILSLLKTFYFLRIFDKFTNIVTMIIEVLNDLTYYLLFFFMMISIQGLMLQVAVSYASPELYSVDPFGTNYIVLIRLALANFDFEPLTRSENVAQHYLFWATWIFFVLLLLLVFMNFIIAQVGTSYNRVNARMVALKYRERAELVKEAEELTSNKTDELFPDSILIREKASSSNAAGNFCRICDDYQQEVAREERLRKA